MYDVSWTMTLPKVFVNRSLAFLKSPPMQDALCQAMCYLPGLVNLSFWVVI